MPYKRGRINRSYQAYVHGPMDEKQDLDNREVSNDDAIEEVVDETWFSIEMTKEEKLDAWRTWRNCLIIKLFGRNTGYNYLWLRIQALWRTQTPPLLIDLLNDIFNVKLGRRDMYERALMDG